MTLCVCVCVMYSLILVLNKLRIDLINKILEVCHPSSFFLFVNTIAKKQQKVCAYNLSVLMVIKDDKVFLSSRPPILSIDQDNAPPHSGAQEIFVALCWLEFRTRASL